MKNNLKPEKHLLGYNTDLNDLVIPEYGRYVQQMVDYLKKIENKQERNFAAQTVIKVMGDVNGMSKNCSAEQEQKLYDQLFMMAEFSLDIDSPYPKPSREQLNKKPEPLKYPKQINTYRFYGQNIIEFINILKEENDQEKKLYLATRIASYMKRCYIGFNKDKVDNSAILEHLFELSKGEIDLRDKTGITLDTHFDPSLQPTPLALKAKNVNRNISRQKMSQKRKRK